jgi:nicotinamidase/pyrazinamidase
MARKPALLILDVQNDLCPGGAYPVPGGDMVVPSLNRYIKLFLGAKLPIIATCEWHPAESQHFKEFGGLWPTHCVAETDVAKFRADLRLPPTTIAIYKGMDPGTDAYSAFDGVGSDGRPFADILAQQQIRELYVGGLATDHCVKETVLLARQAGLSVRVLSDAVRGRDLLPGDTMKALDEMMQRGAEMTTILDARRLITA